MNKGEENIFAEERKRRIVERVNRQAKTTVSDLCEEFGVSPATVRNDLRELEFAGLLKRTHGGAISNKKTNFDLPYTERLVEHRTEKQAIGKLAATMVEPGDILFIDIGTTTRELAMMIAEVPDLTVVTNDLEVAYYLNSHSNATILLTGGFLRKRFNSLFGQTAIDALQNINANKAFLSTEGVTPEKGATNTDINLTLLKREFVRRADEVILLCDSSKIGKSAFTKFADITDIDVIVTDEHIDEKTLKRYRACNVNIEVARAAAGEV